MPASGHRPEWTSSAGFLISKVGITAPRDVTRSCCVMNPAFEGAATFSADDFFRKSVALLVFLLSDEMFFSLHAAGASVQRPRSLHGWWWLRDDSGKVHILFSMIMMAVEEWIGIGLLEKAVARVFLVSENTLNCGGVPVSAFLSRHLIFIQSPRDSTGTLSRGRR